MKALASAGLRRHWRLIGAIAAFAIFTFIHMVFFRPAAARYRSALASVGGLEAVFNPGGGQAVLPPRVYALIAQNTLTPQDALDRGGSGALGVILLEELGRLAARSDLEIASTQPGPVTQEPLTTRVRVQITLRGQYSEMVEFFNELSRSQSLVLVEQFALEPGEGEDLLRLSVSRVYLKQAVPSP